MGEPAIAAIRVELAHRKEAVEDPGVSHAEDDIAVLEDLAAPGIPAGHLRGDRQGRKLALLAGPSGVRSPVIPLEPRGGEPIRHLPFRWRFQDKGYEPEQ